MPVKVGLLAAIACVVYSISTLGMSVFIAWVTFGPLFPWSRQDIDDGNDHNKPKTSGPKGGSGKGGSTRSSGSRRRRGELETNAITIGVFVVAMAISQIWLLVANFYVLIVTISHRLDVADLILDIWTSRLKCTHLRFATALLAVVPGALYLKMIPAMVADHDFIYAGTCLAIAIYLLTYGVIGVLGCVGTMISIHYINRGRVNRGVNDQELDDWILRMEECGFNTPRADRIRRMREILQAEEAQQAQQANNANNDNNANLPNPPALLQILNPANYGQIPPIPLG
ncbi:hypothetical protein F5Y15DRAFT_420840 [Xylariaceae sp. FL0016]|nr:hypothetical protein F5Y15DRAFT_420840 [Xylariaceae sp. FL0016]